MQLYANTKSKADFACSIEDRAGHIQKLNEFQPIVIKTQILSAAEDTQHTDVTLDY
jgi:hypothetical protein